MTNQQGDVVEDVIYSISDKLPSQHPNGPDYYLIEFESGRKCYYEKDDAEEFLPGDEVKGILNHKNCRETIYPSTLENISYIKRKGTAELDEILNSTIINE